MQDERHFHRAGLCNYRNVRHSARHLSNSLWWVHTLLRLPCLSLLCLPLVPFTVYILSKWRGFVNPSTQSSWLEVFTHAVFPYIARIVEVFICANVSERTFFAATAALLYEFNTCVSKWPTKVAFKHVLAACHLRHFVSFLLSLSMIKYYQVGRSLSTPPYNLHNFNPLG